MKIGIIDADLIYKREHNFPNLAIMKLSGYHKNKGHNVKLIHFDDINPNSLFTQTFDKVYISKVFTDTQVPKNILNLPFVEYGGTGFFYDKAPNLPDEIEHSFPDYNLYDSWIKEKIRKGKKASYFKYYTDYSIGFTTRGCFRKCEFCVNRNEKKVYPHSPLSEFLDKKRKKICLLDDNILGCGEHWERIIKELQATKKPFQYKQGMDIRILSDKKAELLSNCKYDERPYFAFDNIDEKQIIEKKLILLNKHFTTRKHIAILYVFCGFDRDNKYNNEFWVKDVIDIFERLKILMKYKCTPYVMRHENWVNSPYKYFLSTLIGWSNMPQAFTKNSLRDYTNKWLNKKPMQDFEKKHPEIAKKYFDLKFGEV